MKTAAPREEEGCRRFFAGPAREEEGRPVMSRTEGQGGGGPSVLSSVPPREEEGRFRNCLGPSGPKGGCGDPQGGGGGPPLVRSAQGGGGAARRRWAVQARMGWRLPQGGGGGSRRFVRPREEEGPFELYGADCSVLKGVGIREEDDADAFLHKAPREEERGLAKELTCRRRLPSPRG